MSKETVKSFEVHRAEDGGYVVREPWTDGRIWVIATIEDLHKWIDVNVIK